MVPREENTHSVYNIRAEPWSAPEVSGSLSHFNVGVCGDFKLNSESAGISLKKNNIFWRFHNDFISHFQSWHLLCNECAPMNFILAS